MLAPVEALWADVWLALASTLGNVKDLVGGTN